MQEEEKNIVQINREKISSTQVREKENLEGILNKHRMLTKRPTYKRKRFYLFLVLLLTILALLYYAEIEEKEMQKAKIEESK